MGVNQAGSPGYDEEDKQKLFALKNRLSGFKKTLGMAFHNGESIG